MPDEAYLDAKIANAAAEFLKSFGRSLGGLVREDGNPVSQRNRVSEPFFLAVGFWRPHLPFLAPEPYWKQYDVDSLTLASNWQPPQDVPDIALHDSRELFGYGGVDRDNVDDLRRQLWYGYYAGISYLDAQIGKVIDALDAAGLADRTVIILWSDHGFHLGQHGLWCKTSCFELDARVPLIIAPPKCPVAGERTDAIVELLDLYPTLADLCGLTPPDNLEGRSLKPLLEEPTKATLKFFDVDDPNAQQLAPIDGQPMFNGRALTQHPRPAYYKGQPEAMGYSLRTDRFRYTEWRDWQSGDVLARELYDHRTDPDETVNEAGSARFQTDLTTLSQQLNQMLAE